MYSDAATSRDSNPKSKSDEDQGQGETALIPKSLCPDMKPGDEVVLKITRGLEDDWEVVYAPKEDNTEESPKPVTAPPGGGDNSMSSMMD